MKAFLEEIAGALSKAAGAAVAAEDIKPSPVADYASPLAFTLAKELGKSPQDMAKEIAGKIKKPSCVEKVDAVGGFVNFTLDYAKIAPTVLTEASREGFGRGKKQGEKIILEHTSINPSGPVHVGRLRNSLIGDSLRRILGYAGYEVETHYFVNNIGKQIAIIAAGLDEGLAQDPELRKKYEKYSKKKDFEIFFEYVAANKKFEGDEGFQKKVQDIIHAAEHGDKKSLEKIARAADLCLAGQKETYRRLGFTFDAFDYESDEITSGRAQKVLEKLGKTPDWITKEGLGSGINLEKFGIEKGGGLTVLERADGTTVYTARDLSYHLKKLARGDRLVNVLGEDHKLQAQELSAVLKNYLDVKKPVDVVHYSFVSFEGAKLSTRKGDTAPVDELVDEAVAKAAEEVEKREIAGEGAAEKIGVGAVKYHIIKTSANKPITFRWDEALSFDGDAAPYIQYAHARSCRILEKAGEKAGKKGAQKPDYGKLTAEEKEVVKQLGLFPQAVEDAARKLQPHAIANHVYSLAAAYSRFYKNCQVLTEDGPIKHRLQIVDATRNTIETGLSLLGIEAPERM